MKQLRYNVWLGVVVFSSFLLTACNEEVKTEKPVEKTNTKLKSTKVKSVKRDVDPIQYSRGQKLYLSNCAACHGKYAEGTADWRKTDKDGKFPPPPLNGTAHTWHHSDKVLADTIKNGTKRLGGNMPAWKGKLNDKEITDILVWIKAQWPDEIYIAWYNNFHQTK